MKISVIIASTRKNRFSEKPAKWIYDAVRKRNDAEAEILDLRDWPLPFYSDEFPPIALAGRYKDSIVKEWSKKIASADAYIIVTPEYNHGHPAVLKNALDWLYFEWNNKPVGFVSWGSVEGARSVEQLRQVSIELQMFPIRNSLNIKDFSDNFDLIQKPADLFLNQLIWWGNALKVVRSQNPPSFV